MCMASRLKLPASQHQELVKQLWRTRRHIMNGQNSLRRIGGFVLAALLMFGTAIMSSTAVEAQGRGHGGGFHGGFHGGGFHGGGFHGGFHGGGVGGRSIIAPNFGT